MRALTLLLSLLILPAAIARTPFPPVDEGARDSSWSAFREQLMDIVERKDAKALLSHVDEKIQFSFGESPGIRGFERAWGLADRPEESGLWRELGAVLRLGGSFSGGAFIAPYVFSLWPDAFDAFEHVAVVASRLRIRAAPSLDAPVLGFASYEILQRRFGVPEAPGWVAVVRPDGGTGYVAATYVRSPLDYRAIFHKKDGWKMQVFVAGD